MLCIPTLNARYYMMLHIMFFLSLQKNYATMILIQFMTINCSTLVITNHQFPLNKYQKLQWEHAKLSSPIIILANDIVNEFQADLNSLISQLHTHSKFIIYIFIYVQCVLIISLALSHLIKDLYSIVSSTLPIRKWPKNMLV